MSRARTPRPALLLAVLLVAPAAPCIAAGDAAPGIVWLDDYGKALAEAQKADRPVMIEFYTSWCLYCGKLEKETFGNPQVASLASDFVCAKLDADVQKAAASRYEPEGYPTVVFAAPSGAEILKVSGFRAAEPFATVMRAVREHGREMAGYLAAIEKNPKDAAAHEALGRTYLDLGLAEQASDQLEAALKAAPPAQDGAAAESDAARIQFLLARASALGKDYSRAIKLLQKLIDASPRSERLPRYYLELERVYAASGKGAKAAEIGSKIGSLFPGTPEAEQARDLLK